MAAKRTDETLLDVTSLFEQELRASHEDLRRQAASQMFAKLHPNNRVTVEQFLEGLRQHKEVWAVVSTMGVLDFASSLTGRSGAAPPTPDRATGKPGKRTRLSEAQKNALKGVIVNVLAGIKDGLTRAQIAKYTNEDLLGNVGVNREELADKLRQPLVELVADGKIHTVGEKRLMRYYAGAKQ